MGKTNSLRVMLTVGSFDKQGGTNSFVRGLSRNLSNSGIYTLVASHKLKGEKFENRSVSKNLEVFYFPAFPRKRYFLPFYIFRFLIMAVYSFYWIKKRKISVILTGETEALPFLVGRLAGAKVVIRGGNPFPAVTKIEFEKNIGKRKTINFIIDIYEKIILFFANKIVILSEWEKPILQRYTKKNMKIIRYAVDVDKFSPGKSKKFDLIYIGRISPSKNIESLVSIFDKVRKKSKCKLYLVGQLEEYKSISEVISKSKNKRDIVYLGEKNADEIPKILAQSKIFVHTAFDLGNAPLEAASSGLPVVVLGKKFDEKYVINSNDEADFSSNIVNILKSKEEYSKISKFNRNYIIKNHSWSSISNEYIKVFRSLLNG